MNNSRLSEKIELDNSIISVKNGSSLEETQELEGWTGEIAPVIVEEEKEISTTVHIELKKLNFNEDNSFLTQKFSRSDL